MGYLKISTPTIEYFFQKSNWKQFEIIEKLDLTVKKWSKSEKNYMGMVKTKEKTQSKQNLIEIWSWKITCINAWTLIVVEANTSNGTWKAHY